MSLIPSALDPRTQAFPVLTEAQIDRVRQLGQLRAVKSGDVLFAPNDTELPFFVLISGDMEILQPGLEGDRQIATHGPGEFTGEMAMISGQRCLVRGIVTQDGEFLELKPDAVRSLIARDPELSEILLRAFILRRLALIKANYGAVVLLGSRHSAQTLELREFLNHNGYPHHYVDLDTDRTAQKLLDQFSIQLSDVPVVVCHNRGVLRNPSIQELAKCLGFNRTVDTAHARDLVIIGAGPAGLAAAVYAASEGLDVLVVETKAPGGQAGSSSRIENYLGFPMGVSGLELAARATTQAQKFGADMMIARSVSRLDCERHPYRIMLDGGEELLARAIVIATGAQYNKPALTNLAAFEGKGVYYCATHIEAQLCEGSEVVVVGGGNSAGQGASFLSQHVKKVHMLVRSGELKITMSRYLIQRLTENPRIELHFHTEITGLEDGENLERVTWRDKTTGEVSTRGIQHVFIMAGASPQTGWLKGCLALDPKGFIPTGRDLEGVASDGYPNWPLPRAPQMLETTLPGVFAVGDARAGNVKRVASAVGEGAIAVHMVHRVLAEF